MFGRTGTEYRFMSSLLRICIRTVIDGIAQQYPSVLHRGIALSVTGNRILPQPLILVETLRTPRQFRQQFKHDRVVFAPLHRHADSFQRFTERTFLRLIELVDHVLHLPV